MKQMYACTGGNLGQCEKKISKNIKWNETMWKMIQKYDPFVKNEQNFSSNPRE